MHFSFHLTFSTSVCTTGDKGTLCWLPRNEFARFCYKRAELLVYFRNSRLTWLVPTVTRSFVWWILIDRHWIVLCDCFTAELHRGAPIVPDISCVRPKRDGSWSLSSTSYEIQTLQAARIGLLGFQNPSREMGGFSWVIHWNVCGWWSRIFSMLWMPQPGLSLVKCARPLFIIWPGCLVGPKVAYDK